MFKISHPEDIPIISSRIKERQKRKKDLIVQNSFRIISKSGKVKWIEFSSKNIKYQGESAILVMVQDISEKKEVELKFKESEKSLNMSQKELSLKNQISNVFLTVPDEKMFGKVLLIILKTMKSEFGIFGYLDEDKILVESSLTKETWQKCAIEDKIRVFPKKLWSKNIYGRVINEKNSLFINKSFNVPEGHVPISNFLGTPIIYDDKVNGILIVANKESDYEEHDVKQLESIADTISPILNVRMQRDIQEKKKTKALEDLKESEECYRELYENAPNAYFSIGIDKIIRECNNAAVKLLGYTKEELMNMNVLNLYYKSKDGIDKAKAIFQRSLKGERIQDEELQMKQKNENPIWISLTVKPVIDQAGQVIESRSLVIDITERKKAEQKLKESEEKYRLLVENSPSSIILLDSKGKIVDCNKITVKYIGIPKTEIIGKNFQYFFQSSDERLQYAIETFTSAIEGKLNNPIQYELINRNKESFSMECSITLFKMETELYIQVVSQDITEQKKLENLRKEENKRLKELNEIKNNLIVRASYELKNPLTSIYNASEILLTNYKNQLGEQAFKLVKIIYRGGKRLNSLIMNLTEISKIKSKKLKLKIEYSNIKKLIHEIINELSYLSLQREQYLNVLVDDTIYLYIDKLRIKQVLSEIILNAINNTPHNGIISINLQEHNEYINIVIKDTGVGFTEEEKEIIFQEFGKIERYGQGMDIITDGMGIGLYISTKIVDLHGGKIWMESEGRNKGSSFIIRLPLVLKEKLYNTSIM